MRLSAVGVVAALLAGLVAGCGEAAGSDDAAGAADALRREPAVVERVTDGDTITLGDGRRVRLVQIDAPELGECYAARATRLLRERLPRGTPIELSRDTMLDAVDAHGRQLRYVLFGGGALNVNVELVREGAAVPYFFHGERGVVADALLKAARQAREAGLGMWSACPRARFDPRRGSLTGPD